MKKTLLIMLVMSFALTGIFARGQGSSESSDKTYELKLGMLLPTGHPNEVGAQLFTKLVGEGTNGKVKISIFPSSQLGNEKDMFDAIALGTLAFATLGFGEPAKQYAPFLIFDAPFVAQNREDLMRMVKGSVSGRLYREMEQKLGVKVLGVFYFGTRHVTTSEVPIRASANIQGLKIRVPDQEAYVKTLQTIGARPTPMAFPEVYLSLQQGVIDGMEGSAATIVTNKLYEVQKYLAKTAHIIGLNTLYISDKIFGKLPAEYQQVLVDSGKEMADQITQMAFEKEDEYFRQLQLKGMTITEVADYETLQQQAQVLHRQLEQRWGKGLLAEFRNQ